MNAITPDGPEPTYFHTVLPALPPTLNDQLKSIPAAHIPSVDTLLRLVLGGHRPVDISPVEWTTAQQETRALVDRLQQSPGAAGPSRKRTSSDAAAAADGGSTPKRARTSPEPPDAPLFALHALSLTTPIRKKADIAVHAATLRLSHPATHAPEHAPLPLAALRRAFLLPTRGKAKPHWSVLLLGADTPAAPRAAAPPAFPQVAFGLDAAPGAGFSTRAGAGAAEAHARGTPVLPALRTFLAHLPVAALEPDAAVFRSALGGAPGVEAYRGAKPGTLWFLAAGVLWDGRPAEFWALADLAAGEGGVAGVRTLSATGRTCSVILGRVLPAQEDGDGGGEREVVDTDFGMVDGKEQEGIARWVKRHCHLFGKQDAAPVSGESSAQGGSGTGSGAGVRAPQVQDDDSDADDSDFEGDSESDGGSATSDSESEAGSANENGDEPDAQASGGEADDSDDAGDLDPAHHPLLRPGAMPRMSRAAIEAVVGMVEDDMRGGASRDTGAVTGSDGEEDELED